MKKEEAFLELKEFLSKKKVLIDCKLLEILSEREEPGARVISAMRYSVMAGGKRLRPILCMLGAEAVGRRGEDFLIFACGIECLHTYSLIHDDLPAMDDDDLRRGKPTCHKAFDEATAILAGDGLQALAFELFTHPELLKVTRAEAVVHAVRTIAEAVGIRGMVVGQMADILAEGKEEVSYEEIKYIHENKTAKFIAASVASGAILAEAPPQKVEALKNYGLNLGIAFQIVDDILDVVGEEEKMGKRTRSDERKKKATFVSVVGLERARKEAKEYIEKALSFLSEFRHEADRLRDIAEFVLSREN